MRDTFEIRSAGRGHFHSAAGLLRECELPVQGVDEHFEGGYAVAVSGGEVIGVCGIEAHGPYGLLRSAAVSPSWRGRSVGRALVENRIAWARERGIRSLYLLTTDASEYFERFGFARVARDDVPSEIKLSSEFSYLCPQSAVVMILSLDDTGWDG